MMIKDLKAMPEGVDVKGFPLMIKTARKAFKDAEGTIFQEVVFMDASGEMTGHILLEESGKELEYRAHHTAGLPEMVLWKSKTNICVMDGILQDTDKRKKEGIKLVVYSCFDVATPLTYDQGQDLNAEDWKKLREDEIKGKIRHGLSCAFVRGHAGLGGSMAIPDATRKKAILEWQDFIMTGE